MHQQAASSGEPSILAAAPRCGARTRSGGACRAPAVKGAQRCRMHGGRGSGAPHGNRNAWKHGVRSAAYRDTAHYIQTSRRFLAAARFALRASALGPEISGPAFRLALAAWADMPPIPAARIGAAGALRRPLRIPPAPKNPNPNEQPHAPGNPDSASGNFTTLRNALEPSP